MARLCGSYSASMFDSFKDEILKLRSLGFGVAYIVAKIGVGTRQSLYNYLKKLSKLGGNKTTLLALELKKALPLNLKIKHAKNRIKEFYKSQNGKVYISYSGGKDSTVLLHLIRTLYKDVEAVFCNTTNEYVEILEHIKKTTNLVTLQPKQTFNELVKTLGFPLVSKKVTRAVYDLKHPTPKNANSRRMYLEGIGSKGQNLSSFKLAKKWRYLIDEPYNITNKCCDILKKDPFKVYEKQTQKKPYIGTSALESKMRKDNYLKYGCNIYEGDAKSRPLSIFSEKDIWAYIKKYNLEYSSIYDDKLINGVSVSGEKRTGCAYCAFGAQFESKDNNRFTRLSLRKPKQFKKMMSLTNGDVSFKEALTKMGVF